MSDLFNDAQPYLNRRKTSLPILPRLPARTTAGGTSSSAWQEAMEDALHLARMAFLGPPSSAYPTDPDKFVFVRVAGGYSPKYVRITSGIDF